jgi:hypothetical protein
MFECLDCGNRLGGRRRDEPSQYHQQDLAASDTPGLPFYHGSQPPSYSRARIFKCLWGPGIDSKEGIPPAYVAWRAGTITLFLLGS